MKTNDTEFIRSRAVGLLDGFRLATGLDNGDEAVALRNIDTPSLRVIVRAAHYIMALGDAAHEILQVRARAGRRSRWKQIDAAYYAGVRRESARLRDKGLERAARLQYLEPLRQLVGQHHRGKR